MRRISSVSSLLNEFVTHEMNAYLGIARIKNHLRCRFIPFKTSLFLREFRSQNRNDCSQFTTLRLSILNGWAQDTSSNLCFPGATRRTRLVHELECSVHLRVQLLHDLYSLSLILALEIHMGLGYAECVEMMAVRNLSPMLWLDSGRRKPPKNQPANFLESISQKYAQMLPKPIP